MGFALPSRVGVGPTCSGLELVLPVGLALLSLGIGVGPSFSWGDGWPFLLAVGVANSGRGWPFCLGLVVGQLSVLIINNYKQNPYFQINVGGGKKSLGSALWVGVGHSFSGLKLALLAWGRCWPFGSGLALPAWGPDWPIQKWILTFECFLQFYSVLCVLFF